MGIVIIFAFITLLAIYAVIRAFRRRNVLGLVIAFTTAVVFGWFSIMTFINNGYPPMH